MASVGVFNNLKIANRLTFPYDGNTQKIIQTSQMHLELANGSIFFAMHTAMLMHLGRIPRDANEIYPVMTPYDPEDIKTLKQLTRSELAKYHPIGPITILDEMPNIIINGNGVIANGVDISERL